MMQSNDSKTVDASEDATGLGKQLVPINSSLLGDVKVRLEARLGTGTLCVKDLLALKSGASIALDTPLNGEIDIILNDAVVARGEVVAVGDQYGVRVTAVAPAEA